MLMYHILSSREQTHTRVAKQLYKKMDCEDAELQQTPEQGDQEMPCKLQVSMIPSSE
jgi:hypothetical protein